MIRAALWAERFGLGPLFLWMAWQPGPWPGRAFLGSCGALLLVARPPTVLPKRARDIVVPLIGTFFYLATMLYRWAPHWALVCVSTPLPRIAAALAALGLALAAWSAASMGRSFGVIVAVRNRVTRGPYRFARHPMYWGYALQLAAMPLQAPCAFYAALTATYWALLWWRSRLEDAVLDI